MEAKALAEELLTLAQEEFGERVDVFPRSFPPKKGKFPSPNKRGLVGGVYRGGGAVGAIWVGPANGKLCGIAVSPNGLVRGLFVQHGTWWRKLPCGVGRKLSALPQVVRVGLPPPLRSALLRGARAISEVLGENFEFLTQQMLSLRGIRAFVRPFPSQVGKRLEIEMRATKGLTFQVLGPDGKPLQPEAFSVTPWGTLLWWGKPKLAGTHKLRVYRGKTLLGEAVFFVFPPIVVRAIFKLEGLRGPLHADRIEKALRSFRGVSEAEVDWRKGVAIVKARPGAILDVEGLKSLLQSLGLKIEGVETFKK